MGPILAFAKPELLFLLPEETINVEVAFLPLTDSPFTVNSHWKLQNHKREHKSIIDKKIINSINALISLVSEQFPKTSKVKQEPSTIAFSAKLDTRFFSNKQSTDIFMDNVINSIIENIFQENSHKLREYQRQMFESH